MRFAMFGDYPRTRSTALQSDRRGLNPATTRYKRVSFEKQYVSFVDCPSSPLASLIDPAHPLIQAVSDLVLEQSRTKLKQGSILIDPADIEPSSEVVADSMPCTSEHASGTGSLSGTTMPRLVPFSRDLAGTRQLEQ